MSDKRQRYQKWMIAGLIFFSCLFMFRKVNAEIMAKGNRINLENWMMSDGAPVTLGSLSYAIQRATIGLPISGRITTPPIIINQIPTFDNSMFTGFLFVSFFEFPNVDDQYDITNLKAFKYDGGDPIQETVWTNDMDPYFTWEIKIPNLPIEGFSVSFDELPDNFVDTTDFNYQTPDFLLNEGPHVFYVIAKNTDGAFGGVGSFEVWVDSTEPTINDYLPSDSEVISDPQPTIQATLFDALSGIEPSSIQMQITTETDTYQVLGNYDPDTGVLSYAPVDPFDDGLITVNVSVNDEAGNSAIPLFWSFTIDTESPSGSILINNGVPSTDTNIVTLNISAIELETTIDAMMISNDGVFDDEVWEPYNTAKSNWILNPTEGIKTVYIKFRDVAQNESEVYSDSILLTIAAPNTFVVSAPPTITQTLEATFVFTATETGSKFSYKLDNADWTELEDSTQVTFTDLEPGNHYFQVRAGFDVDGNGMIDEDEIDTTPALVSWTIGSLNPTTLFSERPVKYYRRE